MRGFETQDGRRLIEWAVSPCDLASPDGAALGVAGAFYLLDGAGEVDRLWFTYQVSDEDDLWTFAYRVEGDDLVSYHQVETWGRDEPRRGRGVALRGLRPLPDDALPPVEAVRAAIDRERQARAEEWDAVMREAQERDVRFERSLPELGDGERIGLVWRYDGGDAVVSRSTGEEVWREPDPPGQGKDTHRRFYDLAQVKYGPRLDGFEVDVSYDSWPRFDTR